MVELWKEKPIFFYQAGAGYNAGYNAGMVELRKKQKSIFFHQAVKECVPFTKHFALQSIVEPWICVPHPPFFCYHVFLFFF
jgi:hypothetical protein